MMIDLNYEENPTHFRNSPIWYNSLIRIANRPIFFRNWSSAGVNHVKDVLDQNTVFLKYNVFKTRYKIKTTFVNYYGVVSSIKTLKTYFQPHEIINPKSELTCGQKLLSSINICNAAYKSIVKRIATTPSNSQEKWLNDCENYEHLIQWDKSYILPFFCTKETKLQSFQFKLLHRRIASNDFLCKIGISLTDKCTFCEQNTETLVHLFWDCDSVQAFWQGIQDWIIRHQIKPQNFSLTQPLCLGLVENIEDTLLHHALLVGRYHIYSSKLNNTLPNIRIFTQIFLKCQEIERCFAYKTNTVQKYNRKWGCFK